MKIREIFLGLTFALIWSSAFTSARISMFDAPPFLLLSVRFLISGLLALAIARFLGQKIVFSAYQWTAIIVFGICQNTIYLGLNFVSMQWIDASIAAIIASLLPLIVTIISWIIFRDSLSKLGLLGLFIGIVGVMIIMSSHMTRQTSALGLLLCSIGVIALAVATIVVRNTSQENIIAMIGLQMLVGSGTLFPLSLLFDTWHINWTMSLTLSFLYTTIFPGLVATLIWFRLLHDIGPIKAASFHFLNPVFGVFIANLMLSEYVLLRELFGVLLISFAIIALQMSNISGTKHQSKI